MKFRRRVLAEILICTRLSVPIDELEQERQGKIIHVVSYCNEGEEKDLRTNNSSDADRLLIGRYVLITSLFFSNITSAGGFSL